MKTLKFLTGLFVSSMILAACQVEDNPTEPPVYVDNPQEEVTDQPAYAPGAE